MKDTLEQIKDLRNEIDNIDSKLLSLLARRSQIVQIIGGLKHDNKMEPFDKKRWDKLMQSILSKSKSLGLSSNFIKKLYEVIHEYSLELQKSINNHEKS